MSNPITTLVRRCTPQTFLPFPVVLLLMACLASLAPLQSFAGTWTHLANPSVPSGQHPMLLSDGTVIFLGQPCSRLTPDIHGSYVNGTWTTLAPMHNSRTFYSSQVLPDGRVFVCGGEYGTGKNLAEIYDPLSNVWTQESNPPDTVIDNISETLPNGNILEGSPGNDVRIFDIVSNTWSAPITSLGGFDEAPWAKLQDGSILGFSGTNSERFIPALNQWVADGNLPAPLYGPGYETGFGAQLPNGKVVFFGGTGSNAVYTPWTTNYNGIYTPNGTTNAGTWTLVASTPNDNAAIDAPAAMMVNGKILCCMTSTNTGLGSTARFYEYDYVTNAFTAINGPEGGMIANQIAYGTEMLDLPDGTVLVSGASSGLYVYQPGGSPLTNGMPTVLSATTNLDGSFHLTGTLFNGISEGAGYGDDWQMSSDYPIVRMTNSAGNTLYARTYNWSTCNLMTGTNLVTAEMTLPPGMLAGTYPLVVSANGISSAPYSLTINGTPLPAVAGLAFSAIVSNQMAFHWNAIGLTETGYVIKRSTDGTNYSAVATLTNGTTNYTDSAVTPLGQYYYLVLGTNSVGLGNAAPAIFAASPPVVAVPAPWQNRDVGFMQGSGAAGTNGGTFTVIGAGGGMGADNDQFQFVYQPMIGDVTITARVVANQNTGSNAMAGVMIRNSLGFDVADSLTVFDGGAQTSIFEHRDDAAALATYGLKTYGLPDNEDAPSGGGGNGSSTLVSQPASAPLWVRLVRSGNTITSYTSTNGSTWTAQGTNLDVFAPVVDVGLAVTSGTYNQLNTSTFDNVTVSGTAASLPPPMAEWKLDETGGTIAEDSIDSFDGLCNNVVLGLPGATPATGYAAGFNGTNANISIPALNLNSNILTITAWVNPNGAQNPYSGIFFNRANTTVSGFHFGVTNELRYTWNNSSGTYSASSGLVPPAGVWTFVALVIEPTRARIYMTTNGGALSSWTNNVANAVQAFDGTSYIGQDPTSGARCFNGLLDEVQFFNQALAPAQLAQMASPPVPAVTAPANGATFPAFASANLSVALSATNGHTLNSVEYFADNGQLLGQSATPPYSATTTNLNIGRYAIFARLYYDSGASVDSALNSVVVTVQPAVTNAWDANSSLAGAQDGNGTWDASTANWWNGSADVAWTDFNFAVFGSGTGTNCTVTLAADVTPYAVTFNAGTGNYTIAGTNSIWLNVPGLPLNITANGNATIGVPLQGDNSLVKLGAGKLTLTASNSYAGETIVAAGMLKLGTNTAFGSDIVVTNPGTLDLNGQDLTASMFGNPVTISGPGAGGTVITNSSSAIRGQLQDVMLSDNATLAGANTLFIGGTNAQNGILNLNGFTLTKASSGTLILNGLNLTGPGNLTINAGTLQLMDNYGNNQQNTVLAGSGTLTINPGASVMTYKWGATLTVTMPVVMNGGTLGSGWPGPNGATYACPITVSNNSTLNFSGGYDNCTLSGNLTGSAGLNIVGGSGTRIFTGTNSYGWTTIGAGTLKIGNGGTTGTLGLGPVTNNATLTFSRTDNLTVSNLIAGSGALIQSGPGTLTLSGANTYAGTTTVGGGTLLVNGSLSTNTVIVQTNATLGGTGTIAGSVLVTNVATLVPGASSPGILAINGSLVLAPGSTSNFRLNKGGVSDQVAGLAGVVCGGTLNVTSIGASLVAGDSFTLFSAPGYSGGFAGLNLPALSAGLVWDTSKLMVNGTIGVAALPAVAVSPASTNITYGGSAAFAANATGTAPLAYQWYGPGQSLISGATNSTLALAMPTVTASGNYTVVVNNPFGSATNSAALTVTPATLTVSANNTNRSYGVVNPAFTASYAGFVNGDTIAVLSGSPSLTATATATSAVGNYSIVAGLGSLAATNYSFAFNNGTLTVNPAALTVSANNTNRIYGAANPAFTASYTGFVNGDTVAVLSGAPSLTTTATSGSAVGTYTIAAGLGSLTATNYSFGFTNGILTVNSAALTVTANNQAKTYGQSLTFGGTEFATSGLLNGDTVTNVTLASTGATNTAAVGVYSITATTAQGTGLGNYTINYVNGTLTVNPAALTVSANNTNRIYGAANPAFTASYTGFANGDTMAVLSGSPSLTTTATTNSAVGTYTITAGLGTLTATNYSFGFTNGILTVNSAALTVTANNQAKTYGQTLAFVGTEFATSGLLNGDTVTNVALVSSGTTNTAGTGSYSIIPSAAQGTGLGNYTISYVNGTLTVNPAALTVSANNTNRIYGAANPAFTASYTGFVNGDTVTVLAGSPSLTTTATTNSAVGTYTITAGLGTLTATNYSFGFTNGILTVNNAALTITANSTNKVYGVSQTFAGTEFAASGLLNGDTVTNVALASTGATNTAAVGGYPVTVAAAQGTGLGNYTISYVNGTLTVNAAALTITANSTNKLYGQTLVFAGTEFTSSGLVNSDTVTNVALASTGATNTAVAGTYPITASGALGMGLGNYAINYVSGTLTVTGSLPTAPQNLIALAIATNQISLTWSAVTNTTGYVVSRGGSAVANVAGTNYTDTGLAAGTPYVYTVAATNAIGSSPQSAPANATTPVLGTTLTWNAGASTNAQDGSGVWGTNLITWLYGTNNLGWYDGNVAAFGVNTATNCTVTLTNDVTPSGITFNATGGGSYTIAGTNNIWLTNSPAFAMNGSGTISTPVNGTGSLTESGGGTLTLTTQNGYSGGTIVNAGKLVSTVSCWYTPRGIGSGLLTVNSGATAEFTATHGFGGDASGRPAVINNGTLQFDHENYVSGLALTGGGITGAGEIRTIGTTYYTYGASTNSLIGCNINMVSACTFSVTNGSSAVGLLVSGTVYGSGGLTKAGPGLLQLTGTATNTGATTVSAGTLQLDGSLGTNTVTVQSAATLSGTGTINGATTIQSGGTLAPGDNAIGTLTISNALTLAGNAAFTLNKSGTTLTGDLVQGLGTVTYGGTLAVTATGSALAAGDSFTLFAATGYAGSFTTITLPTLGSGLAWDTSNLAVNGTIAVAALPVITTQPANQSVTQGSPATFSVTATGTALNYQWQKNGTSIGGATAASYTISSTTTNDAASYSVVISNAVGSTNSATATLTVNVPPGITTQPVSQNINQGSPVTFSVTATGTAPLTYQWLKNGTNISGATSSSYTISSVATTDAANYTVAVANVAGSTNSSAATLTVNVPPTITTQPASQTVIVGNPVTFTVAATGTGPLSYQWQKNGANISGATAASYTVGSVGTNDAANYTAIVTNIAGSVTSSTATLTVNAPFGDWHFDDGTGTVATDSAAVPHNGTVSGTNATWVTGIKGNALQFTGVSNYVAFGTGPSMSGTNNFTIAAWIKTAATNTGVIMQQRDSANYNGEYRLSVNGTGTVEFMVYGDGAYQFDITTTNVLNNGAWHYVVAERNGLTGNIYLDGNPTPVATGTGTGIKNLTNIINVAVGRDIRDNNNNFTGVIDEVKLYKVALNGTDVAGLYNTYLGLVSPWLTADVGSGITTGSATQTNGVFTVQGAGNLSGTADNFRFVYQNMSGDAEIRARIPSYQNTGANGRVGVMMRDSLTANSMNAFMGIQVTNGTFYFQTRTSSGGATTSTSSGTGTAPNIWVRLVRSGTTLSGYKSSDGATWTLVSTNTFTMSTNCYFGLGVASGTTNTLNTATFDNLTVTP